jgi:2-polyprenyl-6-methoxyphenol hydroxylase-like FAD-dependent oxidoreductase
MKSGPIVIVGSGPAGLAAGLALIASGREVRIYERYANSDKVGGLINIWAPAVKALRSMGVDVNAMGLTATHSSFHSASGHHRATVRFDSAINEEYGGYFFGLLRPDLYTSLRSALPAGTIQADTTVSSFVDKGDQVEVVFADGTTTSTPLLIGADGINSTIRPGLWGETPIREHNLQAILGNTYDIPAGVPLDQCIIRHSRTLQGSYAPFVHDGRPGIGWYFVEAWDPSTPPLSQEELWAHANELAKDFPVEQQELVAHSEGTLVRWQIRDRGKPLKTWSKGRVTLAGDAAHATSPYAAYGAGMSIVDGYFIAQSLANVDLADTSAVAAALQHYDSLRVEHTTDQIEQAYMLGQLFHHSSAVVRPIRDFLLDRTPFLQKMVGEKSPGEIAKQISVMGDGIRGAA